MKKLSLWFLNFVRRFNKERYMVNIVSMEIHDLGHEHELCNLSDMKSYALVDKESMEGLMTNGYNGCGHCMKKYDKE